MSKFLNEERIANELKKYGAEGPFDHVVIDNFLNEDVAEAVENEFPSFESPTWFVYSNPLEEKRALNNWNQFPSLTYQVFSYFNSPEFVELLSRSLGREFFSDQGLHGGGWHLHGNGGNLNPHFDYSIHPKLGLQRKLNLIIYLSHTMKEEYGGHLGLWEHDSAAEKPGRLAKEVFPLFNRAILFDTTQNSWHGMSKQLICPPGVYRKSFAIYYLVVPAENADSRGRALYAPRKDQEGDAAVLETIKLRAQVDKSHLVYVGKK